ncbi:Alpha-(1,3)-fucosyltransferase C [Orchesella cincta]|uniref:Fucosyltransferase n=1 Tax=Orchesella cincta TaxID=48709 RepID=A0A1D2N4B6_ORCCI|nr:Alpha-(1,3)-fucosyltransferase C [Orchesella cincta]
MARSRIRKISFLLCVTFCYAVFHCFATQQSLESKVMVEHEKYLKNSGISIISLEQEQHHKPFRILIWTRWYDNIVTDDRGPLQYQDECGDEFIITSDRSQLRTADAIVFSLMDLPWNRNKVNYQFPHPRNPNVPWILAVTEASNYYPALRENYNGIFNWTWSSRVDSEFHVSFKDLFQKLENPDIRWSHSSSPMSEEFLRNKTKVAAWVASSCELVISKREQLVNELTKHGIQIDTYGKCGRNNCGDGIDCFRKLGTPYKFYIAFENSLCHGYSTEKIYNGLYHGMVPIVYGFGNWSEKAPEGSWIDAMDFKTVEELANHIKHLLNDPNAYMEYFKWRMSYGIRGHYESKYHCAIWRQMRDRTYLLKEGDEKFRHVYDYLTVWYHFFRNPTSDRACWRCAKRLKSVQYPHEIRNGVYRSEKNCV